MIDIKLYEKDSNFQKDYIESLKNRGADSSSLEKALNLNQKRKKLVFEIDQLIIQRKQVEKSLLKEKDNKKKKECLSSAQKVGQKISTLQDELRLIEGKISEYLLSLPNICHKSVPVGSSNLEIRKWGSLPSFTFKAQSHLQLGGPFMDTERASKVSGARFVFLRGELAQLERCLAQYMLDVHTKKNGYEEIHVPYIVQESALIGTGQLPKFKEEVFQVSHDKGYLISTAEISITNFYAHEILEEDKLPLRFVAYTPCFRAEAGSYGKDTQGLIRQHQFTKVELVTFSHPDSSYEEHEKLTQHAEGILQSLELPYRVVSLSTEDIGFVAAKCYDLEVWMPSQKTYREISSCSNFEDYQARRAQIRFKNSTDKKNVFVHTLNGSGLAVGRTLVALLENYQNRDGSVNVPSVLQPYMDGKKVILKST